MLLDNVSVDRESASRCDMCSTLVGDHVGQFSLEVSKSGPWVYNWEDFNCWADMPLVSWSAGLLEVGMYAHDVVGNEFVVSVTRLETNGFDADECLMS